MLRKSSKYMSGAKIIKWASLAGLMVAAMPNAEASRPFVGVVEEACGAARSAVARTSFQPSPYVRARRMGVFIDYDVPSFKWRNIAIATGLFVGYIFYENDKMHKKYLEKHPFLSHKQKELLKKEEVHAGSLLSENLKLLMQKESRGFICHWVINGYPYLVSKLSNSKESSINGDPCFEPFSVWPYSNENYSKRQIVNEIIVVGQSAAASMENKPFVDIWLKLNTGYMKEADWAILECNENPIFRQSEIDQNQLIPRDAAVVKKFLHQQSQIENPFGYLRLKYSPEDQRCIDMLEKFDFIEKGAAQLLKAKIAQAMELAISKHSFLGGLSGDVSSNIEAKE